MSTWDGSSKANKLGYGIFIKILQYFGVRPAYFLLRFVSLYYFFFSWASSKAIWYYLRQRMGFSFLKSVKYLYSNYYWFGQALIDRIVLMSGIKNNFSFNFDDETHFYKMIGQGKGGLLLSAHVGNWEIAGHLLKQRLQVKINIVMFDGERQKLKKYLEGVTGARNAHIIVIKDNISHIYEIMEALNRNEFVCMHADRFLPGNKTIPTTFLGKEALFPLGPFTLAAKLDVPVSFVFAMKKTNNHYHFYATASKLYKAEAGNNKPEDIVKDFVAAMMIRVKQFPAQWYNYYPFWDENKQP